MTSLESAARQLTLHQPSLTYFQAEELLLAAYKRLKHAKGYGNLLQTCMNIEFNILCRLSEKDLHARLA